MNNMISKLSDNGSLLGRYVAVSLLNVINHQIVLQIGLRVWGWSGGFANGVAAIVAVFPAYFLSRYWVWQVSGPSKVKEEIVPFWIIAAVGFAVSSGLAEWADRASGQALLVSVASLFGYLIVWVLKFVVLNVLFTRSKKNNIIEPAAVK